MCWVRSTALMKITIAVWRWAILRLVQHQAIMFVFIQALLDGLGQQQLLAFYSPTAIPQKHPSWEKFGKVWSKWMEGWAVTNWANARFYIWDGISPWWMREWRAVPWKGIAGFWWVTAEIESAVCPCSQKGQVYPAVHQSQNWHQVREGTVLSALHCTLSFQALGAGLGATI